MFLYMCGSWALFVLGYVCLLIDNNNNNHIATSVISTALRASRRYYYLKRLAGPEKDYINVSCY
jgi:hypothetical protein